MKRSIRCIIFLSIFHVSASLAVALYASQFNQTVVCGNPLILDTSSLLFLDQDIIIDQDCQLFELAGSFLSTDTLTIDSRSGFSIIIMTDCDFGNVFFQGHQIILKGNTQLVIIPGVSVRSDNTVIVCTQNARIRWL